MNDKLINNILAGTDEERKLQVFNLLEKSGNLTHLKALLQSLKNLSQPRLKIAAVAAASAILKQNLLQNYTKMDQDMRRKLAQIMKTIDPNVINSIAQDLKAVDEGIRFKAIRVLGLMGSNPHIKRLLVEMITDRNEMVRATAVSLLKQMVETSDLTLISKLLNDTDTRVVANTIETIEAIGENRLVQLIIRFKSHPNNRIRGNALKAMWKLEVGNVFADIQRMITDPENFLMRASACWVIGECAKGTDFEYLELLASLVNDTEKLVRENVIKAQLKIGGDSVDRYLNQMVDPAELKEIKKSMGNISKGKQ